VQSAARFATFPARAADSFLTMKRIIPPTIRARALPVAQARSSWAVWIGFVCLALLLALAPRAHAQVFNSTPYVAAPDPAVEELRKRVEQLEADLRKAVDRSEMLGAQLSDARRIADEANAGRKKTETELSDVKDRVETLEQAGAAGAPSGGAPQQLSQAREGAFDLTAQANPPPPPVDVAALAQDEEGLFGQARGLLLNGDYPGAQAAFATFIAKFPKSANASEAQYFIGEALLYQDNYADAAAAYGKLIKTYPNAAKGPDGLVKLARSLRLMDKPADACKTLDLMAKQFPKASATAKQMASTERQRASCKG
jgi:tol-pal system protein YbgF